MLIQPPTLDSTMESVTVVVVFGVELWPLILQSGMQELSTALLKVQKTSPHVMSSAITVYAAYDIVVVCVCNTVWMQAIDCVIIVTRRKVDQVCVSCEYLQWNWLD